VAVIETAKNTQSKPNNLQSKPHNLQSKPNNMQSNDLRNRVIFEIAYGIIEINFKCQSSSNLKREVSKSVLTINAMPPGFFFMMHYFHTNFGLLIL
jgi:hypothetical protein